MPMSSALTAPTMKSSIKCTRTLISHCNSIINCAIGNTPTTACAPTSRSPTSPHWNSSPVGKLIGERQSVTNLLDEYTILLHGARQPKLKEMIPASFQIRDLTIRPAAVLAPMAGVTDTLFRCVIRGLGGCGFLIMGGTTS